MSATGFEKKCVSPLPSLPPSADCFDCIPQGPRPTDEDQALWAPMTYFVHSVAGTMIAMMHKLGMFRLRINYGVKAMSDYLFNFECDALACLVDKEDVANQSRYFESYQCRMVAETVLRSTFDSMLHLADEDEDQDDSDEDGLERAMAYTIHSITNNAMDLTLLPVLHERFIQRIVSYEPLLGMATLGLILQMPVVSMTSVLQLLDGQTVTDKDDETAMRNYLVQCLEGQDGLQMCPYMGVDEFSNPSGKLPGTLLCHTSRAVTLFAQTARPATLLSCAGIDM